MWLIKRDIDANIQQFSKRGSNEEPIVAPIFIGNRRYEIKNILSSGGFGIIYKAIDTRLGNREVLIKARRYDNEMGLFLHKYDVKRYNRINAIRENTRFEIKALSTFKKGREARMPNVNNIVEGFCPSIYGPHTSLDGEIYCCGDIDENNNNELLAKENELLCTEPYIVMQTIPGETLGQYIEDGIDAIMKRRGFTHKIEWEKCVLEYAKEIASILKDIHKEEDPKIEKLKQEGAKVYHIYQDLKPENIMITDDKVITLLDFGGITGVLKRKDETTISNLGGCGNPGIGTEGYMAPESITMPDRLDKRVDVYTLGVTVYHLLMGGKISDLIEPGKRIDIGKMKKQGYTPATCELVGKCTEFNREDRYKNMGEVRDQIMKCFRNLKTYYYEQN